MRDLSSPLGVSIFDGDGKHKRKVRRAKRQHEKKTKSKSKFGEARGISTKAEDKKEVYCKPGRQQAKSCAGSEPTGAPRGGRN